jgi:hypothetical protein
MVTRSQSTQVVRVVSAVQLRMLFENRIVARLQRLPGLSIAHRNLAPSTHVTMATMIGTTVWNGLLNCGANTLQIVRQVTRVEVGLHRHHAATNVHSHGGGNNCTLCRNDAEICGASDGLLLATPYKVVDVTDTKSVEEATLWWKN